MLENKWLEFDKIQKEELNKHKYKIDFFYYIF